MKKIIIFLGIIILFTGCSNVENTVLIEENIVKITPSQLFEGESKKLEPHMDLTTGCVKVDYSGDKKYMGIKYEIWKNGEIINENAVLSTRIENGFNGEISFSVKKLINDDLETIESIKMNSVISREKGYSVHTTYIDKMPTGYSYGPTNLDEEIKVSDDNEIIIWGIGASENGYSSYNDIERTLVKADWALVLKLEFSDDFENK